MNEMIQRFAVATLLTSIGACAHALQFNKDALKAMQEEGHKIVEEAEGVTIFKGQGGFCLDTAGTSLVVRTCSDAGSQRWRFDDENRLVAHSKQCVESATLRKCAAGDAQVWAHDDEKRLVNRAGQCLQIQGSPRADAKVTTAACSDEPGQVWRKP